MTDRGVSITISHVLTLGIMTILLSGLLLGASSLLEQQQRTATDGELRSLGDYASTDLRSIAVHGLADNSTVQVHPRYTTGRQGDYRLQLRPLAANDTCVGATGYDGCLRLTATDPPVTVETPVSVPPSITIEQGTAHADRVQFVYQPTPDNGTITITPQ